MSHWVTHENPSCSHPRECLQVEFPSKETEQINPRGEQKTMVLHAFFILLSSVNQLSLHISPSLSSPLGLSPPLPGTHLFLSWASSHASLMSPYSAPVEMSIIEFTCLLGPSTGRESDNSLFLNCRFPFHHGLARERALCCVSGFEA